MKKLLYLGLLMSTMTGMAQLKTTIYSGCDSVGTPYRGYASAYTSGGVQPYTYLWSNGKTTQWVSGLSNGSYAVTVTDHAGSKVVGVDSLFCQACKVADFTWYTDSTSHTIWITNTTPSGYNQSWDMGDGHWIYGATGSYTYTNPGTYNVCLHIYSTANFCSDSKCVNLKAFKMSSVYTVNIVNPSPLGINNAEKQEASLSIYPSPAKGVANISYELKNNSDVTLEVYDIVGNKVAVVENLAKQAGAYQTQFNVQQLNAGIYLVKLNAEGHVSTTRIVIEK